MESIFVRRVQHGNQIMIRRIRSALFIIGALLAQCLSAQDIQENASSGFASNSSVGLIVAAPSFRDLTGGNSWISEYPEVALLVPLTERIEWQFSGMFGGSGRDYSATSYAVLANDPAWYGPFQFASGNLCLSHRFLYHTQAKRGISARFGLSLWTVLAARDAGSIWKVMEQFSVKEGKIGVGLIAGVNIDVNSNMRFSAYVTPQYSRVRWSNKSGITGEVSERIRLDELSVPIVIELAVKPF